MDFAAALAARWRRRRAVHDVKFCRGALDKDGRAVDITSRDASIDVITKKTAASSAKIG